MSWLFTSGGQSTDDFSISPSNEYSGLISFRINWFDLLAVQGTLKSLLQYHSPKASILWLSAFFMVQVLHPYMTTGKTIAFTIMDLYQQSNVSLFNMLVPWEIIVICCCSVTQSCLTLQPHGLQHHPASLSFTNSLSLLKIMSIESLMP